MNPALFNVLYLGLVVRTCVFFSQRLDREERERRRAEKQRLKEEMKQDLKKKCKDKLLKEIQSDQSGGSTCSSTVDLHTNRPAIEAVLKEVFKPLLGLKFNDIMASLSMSTCKVLCVVLKNQLGKIGVYGCVKGNYCWIAGDDLPIMIQKGMILGEYVYCANSKSLQKSFAKYPHLILIN